MDLPDWIDLLQWPAMAASLLAAWLVASNQKHRRNIGFWVFLVSNVLWTLWGWHDRAWALIALQVALAALNIRGVAKTEQPADGAADVQRIRGVAKTEQPADGAADNRSQAQA